MKRTSVWLNQILPLTLTAVIFCLLSLLLYLVILVLNHFSPSTDIATHFRWEDVLFGIIVYLKTSVDFAIFIGNLVKNNPGYQSRIAVEISTALANALGTIVILVLWTVFRKIDLVLAAMVFIASLALIRMAQDGLDHARQTSLTIPGLNNFVSGIEYLLGKVNKVISPFLSKIIPNASLSQIPKLMFWPLFSFAFTVPFILGLDNFAGYVPLFSIVNVFGFSIGIFLGHMILNILLYLSPSKTIRVVANPLISLLGSLVFIGLAIYGLYEVTQILTHIFY